MLRPLAFAAALLFAAAPVAAAEPAAVLTLGEGTVLVNQGEEFISATDGQALHAGDRVMLMEGASASLGFSDGCALPLAGGALLEVPAVSTCAGGLAQVQTLGPTLAQAEAEEGEGGTTPAPKKPFMQTTGGVVAVVAAVAVVAVVAGGGSDNDSPASP